jgi:cytochrome c oxidase subunit 2
MVDCGNEQPPGEFPMIRKLCTGALLLAASSNALAEWAINMPKGITELSAETHQIHMIIFWWCVAIAVVVFGAMIYSLFAHRKSKGAVPATFSHSMTAEVIWTVIPVVILLIMAVPSAELMIKLEDTRDPDLTIVATGYQWKWHYTYQGEDVAYYSTLARNSAAARRRGSGIDPSTVDNYLLDVDNPLVIPQGAKVRLLLTSNDVVHAWWVPDLAIKKDAIPGFMNETWFKAEQTGTFRGQCAELCGMDHGYMPIVVEVLEPAEFQAWLENEKGGATSLAATSGEQK